MKVKELIEKLKTLDQDYEIFAKDEFGWFYPADIIEEDAVCKRSYNILGKSQKANE